MSLLTPFRAVDSVDDVELGRDGVCFRAQGRSSLYLPEVAVDQGWDRETMMTHLCRKAGLPEDCWRSEGELFAFRTTLIQEPAPRPQW